MKNTGNNAVITLEKLLFNTILNGNAFHVDKNVIKRKHELSKIQGKEVKFINRLKYAEQKIFCFCVDVYKNIRN